MADAGGQEILVIAGMAQQEMPEAIDQIASEQLASGHWRVLHLPINTAGVEIECR